MLKIWISDGNRHENVESGYGQTSVAIARGLRQAGHDVRFRPFGEMDVCLFVCPPYSIRQIPDVPSAAYSLHELETLSPEKQNWPEILNRLDLLITATDWNRRIWQRLGVSIPIEVVPDGVDLTTFYPITGKVCTFLCVHANLGSASSREQWRDTLTAYLGAFTRADPVRLVTKTWDWRPPLWAAALNDTMLDLGIEPEVAASVEVIGERLSGDQMRELYHRSWMLVKNAEREGWSLPCTEAIACGRPIAATRIEPLLSVLPDGTRWFELHDIDALRRIMRTEYDRFRAFRDGWQRYPASAVGRGVGSALERLVAARAAANRDAS